MKFMVTGFLVLGFLLHYSPLHASEVELHLGTSHSCLRSGDKVSCSGNNDGQILTGKYPLLQQIETAGTMTCLRTDGRVECFGTYAKDYLANLPKDLHGVQRIGLGHSSLCAQTGDVVKCWGDPASKLPIDLSPAASFAMSDEQVCVLLADRHSYRCWSTISGDSKPIDSGSLPSMIDELLVSWGQVCTLSQNTLRCPKASIEGVIQAAAAAQFTCALTKGGVDCVGNNSAEVKRVLSTTNQDRLIAYYGSVCAYSSDPKMKLGLVCYGGAPAIAPVFSDVSEFFLSSDKGDCGLIDGQFKCWSLIDDRIQGRFESTGSIHQLLSLGSDRGSFFIQDDKGFYVRGFDRDRRNPVSEDELFHQIFPQASEVRGPCARVNGSLSCWTMDAKTNHEIHDFGAVDQLRGMDGWGGNVCFNTRSSNKIRCYDSFGTKGIEADYGSFIDYNYWSSANGPGSLYLLKSDQLVKLRQYESPIIRSGFKNASKLFVLAGSTCVVDADALQCFDELLNPIPSSSLARAEFDSFYETTSTDHNSLCSTQGSTRAGAGKLKCATQRDLKYKDVWQSLLGVTKVMYLRDQTCAYHQEGLTCWGEKDNVSSIIHDYLKF